MQRVAEISSQFISHGRSIGRLHSRATSLADVKRGVYQRDVPGVVKAGTGVISRSDPCCNDDA